MGLTGLEARLLKAIATPIGRRLSVEELADAASCKPDTIYQRLQENPEFHELFKQALTGSLTAEIPEILNAFTQHAKGGSFKHGKLILELAGIYKEDKKQTLAINVHESEVPFKNDEERHKFLQATLSDVLLKEESEDDS